uniref:Uncharacterized protein n=1 Tax=Klebsiella pneumoniae TaxID=573 RepID=A0A6G9HKR3_KLEPN|nr:hypothetical protein [Klebsiella pneumoniae]
MILVKIIKLRWIHILSYDQMVSRKINNPDESPNDFGKNH